MGTIRVLVTGGAGFVGCRLVRNLIQRGAEVAVFDNFSTGSLDDLEMSVLGRKMAVWIGDVCDLATFEPALRWGPDVIVHLAGQPSVLKSIGDPIGDARLNIMGTLNVLSVAARSAAVRLVFASSGGAVYGNLGDEFLTADESHPRVPLSPYGASKLAAETYVRIYCQLYGIQCISLALANVYGLATPSGRTSGVVGRFVEAVRLGQHMAVYGDGSQTRDFVHVDDVARALMMATYSDRTGYINIGSGVSTTVNELVRLFSKILLLRLEVSHLPAFQGEVRHNVLNIGQAESVLGWRPGIKLEDGLRLILSSL
jgi:UDP-glucose 4-epimerase